MSARQSIRSLIIAAGIVLGELPGSNMRTERLYHTSTGSYFLVGMGLEEIPFHDSLGISKAMFNSFRHLGETPVSWICYPALSAKLLDHSGIWKTLALLSKSQNNRQSNFRDPQ